MLSAAAEKNLFSQDVYRTDWNEKIEDWSDCLQLRDFTRFSAFTLTPAGRAFTNKTSEIPDTWRYELSHRPLRYSFRPNLNQHFIVEILEADGVVAFSSPTDRQNLIREINAALAE